MSTRTLIIADHLNGELNESTARAVTCAGELDGEIDILVLAGDGHAIAEQAAQVAGVNTVKQADHPANEHLLAATAAPQIVAAVEAGGYSHILCPNTTFGKDLMPRVAALLDTPMVTDIMAVHGPHTFDRPIYAGNAITTVEAPSDHILVGTVRCASYSPAEQGNSATIDALTLDVELPAHTRYVDLQQEGSERPDLQTAKRVVSGGRGVGSEENFKIVYGLADKLGAAVGASRAAVDAGYVPSDMQVGQTGKIIAPDLYLCLGISGAIQHLAGIKDAGTIVAVNKDEDAPIFEVADIGLVGDLFEVIPELESKLG